MTTDLEISRIIADLVAARKSARSRRLKAIKFSDLEDYNEAHGEATGLSIAITLLKNRTQEI